MSSKDGLRLDESLGSGIGNQTYLARPFLGNTEGTLYLLGWLFGGCFGGESDWGSAAWRDERKQNENPKRERALRGLYLIYVGKRVCKRRGEE